MRIKDICSRKAECVGMEATAREVAKRMGDTHADAVIVLAHNGRTPIGIVTERDLVAKVLAPGLAPDSMGVGQVMTRDVATCGAGQDLYEAARIMNRRGVRKLPVLDESGSLLGIISSDEIFDALTAHMRELSRALAWEELRELDELV